MSCGQNYNSNSFDASNTGDLGIDCGSAAGARLCAAYTAFKGHSCFTAGCHGAWSDFKTDAAWIGSGLVTAGNPDGSTLIQNLRNAGGDMPRIPPATSQLSDTEYQAVRTWIQNL